MAFCKEFNAKTQDKAGDVLPVIINVYADKSFTFVTRQSPVSRMILKELGIESGSKVPNRDKVGKLTKAQVRKLAKQKQEDMRIGSEEAAMMMVMGTARSMGVDIVED
jgi:large subunit ribosomal protein L11